MATYTENYQLHQWVPEDDFLRTDFNTDFQKIDAALAALSTLAVGKASQEELDALESAIASVQTLANGRARAIMGSYTGDGSSPGRSAWARPHGRWPLCLGQQHRRGPERRRDGHPGHGDLRRLPAGVRERHGQQPRQELSVYGSGIKNTPGP